MSDAEEEVGDLILDIPAEPPPGRGDTTFRAGVPEGSVVFNTGGEERLRICPDGTVLREGKEIATDQELYDVLNEWCSLMGRVLRFPLDLNEERIRLDVARNKALDIAVRYGGIAGDHHKAWVIDQMVRVLAGDDYEQVVKDACTGEDGPDSYDWDEGIAP